MIPKNSFFSQTVVFLFSSGFFPWLVLVSTLSEHNLLDSVLVSVHKSLSLIPSKANELTYNYRRVPPQHITRKTSQVLKTREVEFKHRHKSK